LGLIFLKQNIYEQKLCWKKIFQCSNVANIPSIEDDWQKLALINKTPCQSLKWVDECTCPIWDCNAPHDRRCNRDAYKAPISPSCQMQP